MFLQFTADFFTALKGASTAISEEYFFLAEVAIEVNTALLVSKLAGMLSPFLQAPFVHVFVVALASAVRRSAGENELLKTDAALQSLRECVALEGFRALEDH